jgi:Phage gp6-like head-tail connector protein
VKLASIPAAIAAVSPVGYVDFTAGWTSPANVPAAVKVAVKSLAAHWYENREAYTERRLDQVQQGWDRVTNQHKLGLFGSWGQTCT